MRKLTTAEFISKARLIHGDKYDYSLVEYIDRRTKVIIICPIHGAFLQTPDKHLSNNGCPKCSIQSRVSKRTFTKEDFIAKAREKHGDKYDYSKVHYVNSRTKVCIICPVHGEFWQGANEHIRLNGCPECSYDTMSLRMKNNNLGYINTSPREDRKFVKIWQRMFLRCYNPYYLKRNPTYIGCNVCEEWKDSAKFVEWCKSEKSGYREGYALDKDILIKGNKIYSPQTCRFVPEFVNGLFSTHKRYRGECPIGVRKTKHGTYQSLLTEYGKCKCLGTYRTIEEAFSKYKIEKERYLKEIAECFFQRGEICFDIYNALINYEVEITD